MGESNRPRAAGGRWGDGETTALIDAWVSLRRASGRVDWRAAAIAVNAYRASAGARSDRSAAQCRRRAVGLRRRYREEASAAARGAPLGWGLFPRLRAIMVAAGCAPPCPAEDDRARGDAAGGGAAAAAVDEPGCGGAGEESEDTGVKAEPCTGPAPADDGRRRAPVAGVARRLRSGRPVSGSAAAAAADALGGDAGAASEAGFGAAVEGLFAGGMPAPRSGGTAAAVSAATEVAIRLAEMCQNVMLQSLHAERDAARAARQDGAAGRR
ncbi:hypothetical protein ACP4OV_011874 [Aristida adscensionis]